MSEAPPPRGGFSAVLLDIEGTTTPIEFVTGTLFPFARARLADFLRERGSDPVVSGDLERLRAEHASESASDTPPRWDERDGQASALAYLLWLMDRDRKSTVLKSLQGRIWEAGFLSGALVGPLYPDVPAAIERWSGRGLEVAIFSSGSVLAQRLIFAYSTAGDLTPRIAAFFDTATGPKREAGSYRKVSQARGRPAPDWLFLSDVIEELDAARKAGMQTALVVRPDRPEPGTASHRVVRSFDELS